MIGIVEEKHRLALVQLWPHTGVAWRVLSAATFIQLSYIYIHTRGSTIKMHHEGRLWEECILSIAKMTSNILGVSFHEVSRSKICLGGQNFPMNFHLTES